MKFTNLPEQNSWKMIYASDSTVELAALSLKKHD